MNYHYSRFFSNFLYFTVFPEIYRFTNENDGNKKIHSRLPGKFFIDKKAILGVPVMAENVFSAILGVTRMDENEKKPFPAHGNGR